MKILFLTRLTLFTLRSPFYFLSLSFFYMPFSFAFYRGFINRQGNLLPSIPPSLVHPFFLLPPTPRRSLAAREYGIEGRIITEKKKRKRKNEYKQDAWLCKVYDVLHEWWFTLRWILKYLQGWIILSGWNYSSSLKNDSIHFLGEDCKLPFANRRMLQYFVNFTM